MKFETGVMALMEFTYTKKRFKGYFKGMATIKEMDGNYMYVVDNDSLTYLVSKSKVTKYELHG